MIGISGFSSIEKSGYRIGGVSFGEQGTRVRVVKKGGAKKPKPKYNYKLISAAILRAKTKDAASQAAIKARQKLGELLLSVGSGESSDPDIQAAIIHVRKMELIAKRKREHLEQEEMAERGQTPVGEEEEKTEEAADKKADKASEKEAEKTAAEQEKQISEEIERLERELAKSEEKLLEEEMPELEGFEDVFSMSADDVKELKRKHRSDELRDITKADMDYLKAKFNRLQQEKSQTGVKGTASGGDIGNSYAADVPSDVVTDGTAGMETSLGDIGTAVDIAV